MKIRLATKKDAKDVTAIIKRHSQSDYMGYATFNEGYIKDKMKRNNFFFVAITKDERTDARSASSGSASSAPERIVGCIRASVVDIDLAEIRQICVDEEYRKKGIASGLITKAMEFLKKEKMRKVVARSKSDNASAIALFEKFGFEREGHFREHYRKGIDIVQVAKFV